MKIIFDIGANQGQNLNYFLEKADVVVAFEANSNLVSNIKEKFKDFIDSGKLVIENVAIIDDGNIEKINFFIKKGKGITSTLFPENPDKLEKQEVKCGKASLLIKKYLEIYKISEIEYIKIDIEGADHLVLNDLLINNVLAKNLSVECHKHEVIELLLKTQYKSFKFVKGGDLFFKENVKITTKDNNKKIINFDKHSSGPYGDDIPGDYYDKNSILPFFLNNGLGWIDVHCSLKKKNNLKNIKYLSSTHLSGFKYHLKNILPSFVKAIKYRLKLFFKKN
jgi:FkbM family methyltransferase